MTNNNDFLKLIKEVSEFLNTVDGVHNNEELLIVLNELYKLINNIQENSMFGLLSKALQEKIKIFQKEWNDRIGLFDIESGKAFELVHFLKENLISIFNNILLEIYGEVPIEDFICIDSKDIDY